ncbi:cytochrome c biogenesis CcdA family protein [Peptoniphilaceae bacterium SGI.131]
MLNDILTNLSWLLRQGTISGPILALFAGILTSLTPCSISSMPLIIAYVGGNGSKDWKLNFKLSLVFSLGLSLTFILIGIVSALLGRLIGQVSAWLYLLLGIFMIMMAIQVWGIYYFIHPSTLINKSKLKGYLGAFITGIFAGFFSSACATPVMIALMTMLATASVSLPWVIVLFVFFAIGYSIINIIVGSSVTFINTLEKFGKGAEKILGFLIFILGTYYIYLAI